GTNTGGVVSPHQLRTLTTRLMSPALMNFGSGGQYSTVDDMHHYTDGSPDRDGLTTKEGGRVLRKVLKLKVDSFDVGATAIGKQIDRDEAYDKLRSSVKK